MTAVPATEPLRSALSHFAFAMSVARDGKFAIDDDQGQRDRYAIEGALYLGAASIASASGWIARQPARIRYLAYSVVDLDARVWEGLGFQEATDLRLRLQAARVVAGLIEAEGAIDAALVGDLKAIERGRAQIAAGRSHDFEDVLDELENIVDQDRN